jgi:hypothetical protein
MGGGFGATGPGDGPVAGEVGEPAECHLRAPGVVDAQEQHRGFAVGGHDPGVGQSLEALAGESFGADDEPVPDGGGGCEVGVAADQQRLDGFFAEDAAVLGVQLAGGCGETHAFGLCHVVSSLHRVLLPARPGGCRAAIPQAEADDLAETVCLAQAWVPI